VGIAPSEEIEAESEKESSDQEIMTDISNFLWTALCGALLVLPFWLFFRAIRKAQSQDRAYENDSSSPDIGPSTGAF
jgi:bacteriorhodopsin